MLGAWGAIEFASAAENGIRWGERPEEGVLVIGFSIANKSFPVLVPQPLAHAKELPDARAWVRRADQRFEARRRHSLRMGVEMCVVVLGARRRKWRRESVCIFLCCRWTALLLDCSALMLF